MRGRAHVFRQGRINADDILPWTQHNGGGLQKGDILVAGEDFGLGSVGEHAVWALRDAGIAAVVARSFSRLFFRNALNNGFCVVECPEAVEGAQSGDLIEVDLQESVVRNLTRGETHTFVPFTPFAMEILEAGGLLPYVLRQTTGASSA